MGIKSPISEMPAIESKRWMPWLLRENRARPGAAWLAAAVIAVTCPRNVSSGEDSARPDAPTGAVTTVALEYQETGHPFLFRHVTIERRTVPFPKEPAATGSNVVRGLLKFGDNPGNAIPFLWQGDAKKLFLDLNRNQDLTDDADGVFPARVLWSAGPTYFHQAFTNIHLSFPATSGSAPMLVDLQWGMDTVRHPGQALCDAELRSFWQGKVTVAGHDWQVGLMQNLSDQPGSFRHGQLLLRPWDEQARPFAAASEKTEDTLGMPWEGQNQVARASEAFAFSPGVFFEGRAWQLDWNAEPRNREEKLALRLTEQQTPLGELQINGRFIERLVLAGGPYVVVLDRPPASVKVPPGRYQPYRVRLKQDGAEAYFNYGVPQTGKANVMDEITGAKLPVVSPPPPEQAVVVDERRPVVLAVGGPLTNCASATHRGRNLMLSYRLIGAGGGSYWLDRWDNWKQPRFTVGTLGKQIGSGEFEYG
jgi:hypothetical protein